MYKKISIVIIMSLISACAKNINTTENMKKNSPERILMPNDNNIIDLEKAEKYELFKSRNIEQIQQNKSTIQNAEIERQVRNLTMDLLANIDNTEGMMVLVNPVTVIDAETRPYAFENNILINMLLIKELIEYGITVVDESIFQTAPDMQNHLFILDTEIYKRQDKYKINCFFKLPNSSKIYSAAKGELSLLSLDKSKDGVPLLN